MSTWRNLLVGISVGALVAAGCGSTDDTQDDDAAPAATEVNAAPIGSGMPVLFSTDMTMGLTTGASNGTVDQANDVDDSWAFALAVDQGLDVRGVVVTMGNGMVRPAMVSAARTVEAVGVEVPVVEGADVWLPIEPMSYYTGEALPEGCVNDGVEFMATELRRTDDLTIVAIGPLTDLACLALNFPDEASRIREIVALVGTLPNESVEVGGRSLADFNYWIDPRAQQVLLEETDIPFTAIMFGASSAATIGVDEIIGLADSDDELARFFGEASTAYAEFWEETFSSQKPIWDANVVWYLVQPEAYQCELAGFELQTGAPRASDFSSITDWFSPEYTDTRQVTACSAFADQDAIDEFNAATLAAVNGQ